MERYGRLSIISKYRKKSGKSSRVFCDCICDCGELRTLRYDCLADGRATECKICAKKTFSRKTSKHGMCNTRPHRIWLDMKQRCENPKNTSYLYYGEKGIYVCKEWRDSFIEFYDWLISHGYNDSMTVDRIVPSGPYSPENCQLISQSENTIKAHLGKNHIRRSKAYGKRS